MLYRVNLKELHKYPIYELGYDEDSFTYIFDTDNDIKYFVKFNKANHLFNSICSSCQNIFEISFAPSVTNPPHDDKVSVTIQEIIHLFLVKHECPLIYVCDTTDGRGFCRSKLFKKWCFEGVYRDLFKHDTRVLEFNDYSMILGIIAFNWDNEFDSYLNEIDTDSFA